MIKAIFFARFHPGKGPVVVHQVPDGSIIPSSVPPHPSLIIHPPLFDFSLISEYIIPRQEFCDRLVTVCVNHQRVIGYPVCIVDESKYERNQFIFNFAVVMEEKEESAAWEMVVRKLGLLMRSLEEQSGFLSKEELDDEVESQLLLPAEDGSRGRLKAKSIYALCEMIMEDLNNYSECMIPIDDSNTLNLKLFPPRPPPPHVHGWHVPLAIVRLTALQTSAWDLTISQIIPHINGINSVRIISQLADTDFALTRKAIQHLLYYHCILLLDIFQFSAIYAPTPDISIFLTDEAMQEECLRYVTIPDPIPSVSTHPHHHHHRSRSPSSESPSTDALLSPSTVSTPSPTPHLASIPQTARPAPSAKLPTTIITSTTTGGPPASPTTTTTTPPPAADPPTLDTLRTLYTTLKQGLTVRHWCAEHAARLARVDVRRLLTFGVIKGFLYRVHKYAVAEPVPTPPRRGGGGKLAMAARRARGRDGGAAGGGKQEEEQEKAGEEGQQQEEKKNKKKKEGREGEEGQHDAFRLAAMSSGWATPAEGPSGIAAGLRSLSLKQGNQEGGAGRGDVGSEGEAENGGSPKKSERELLPLARYLDGMHCFDEVCSDLAMSEREVLGKLKGYGEVCVIHR
ncbi:MAG: Nitrogen permease regulator 2 [Bathelium mastoideum]|nr:MAG: Nitrogen permease regulator 2 [Bathelium mastoideum]